MKASLPPPPVVPSNLGGPETKFLVGLIRWVTNELRVRPTETQPVALVHLISPNGSVYAIHVDDTGALTSAKVA